MAPASFHLYKYQGFPILKNQINFPKMAMKVSGNKNVTFIKQKLFGQILAMLTGGNGGHNTTSLSVISYRLVGFVGSPGN